MEEKRTEEKRRWWGGGWGREVTIIKLIIIKLCMTTIIKYSKNMVVSSACSILPGKYETRSNGALGVLLYKAPLQLLDL